MKVGWSRLGLFIEKRILPSKLPAKMTAGVNNRQRRSEVILFMAGEKTIFAEKTQGGCENSRDEFYASFFGIVR